MARHKGPVRIISPMTKAQVEKWKQVRLNGVRPEYHTDLLNFDVYEAHDARYISHDGEMWPEWDAPNNDPNDWWES
jgi:hypothetical protein